MSVFKLLLVATAFVACGCTCGGLGPDLDSGIGVAPQVTLTVESATVISDRIKGTVTVSQCASVTQVELLGSDQSFIADANFKGNPTTWEIARDLLSRFYAAKGLALPLTLFAKVVCDDGRTGLSPSVSVTFMPVASTRSTPGVQMLPDSFIAEGGVGGTATTFLGCIVRDDAFQVVRMNTNGEVIDRVDGAPFNCSANSVITERSRATSTRWLLEPNRGAFAFDDQLNITNSVRGKVTRIGVGSDGNAIIFEDDLPRPMVHRVNRVPVSPSQQVVWSVEFPEQMIATPVVDAPNGWVFTASWQKNVDGIARIVMIKYAYADGTVLNTIGSTTRVPELLTIDYGTNGNRAIAPRGEFSPDGTLLYMPLPTFDVNQNQHAVVLACATGAGGCEGPTRRWSSMVFPTVVKTAAPFANGNFIAAASETEVYVLNASDGGVANLGLSPQTPAQGLIVLQLQPGLGTDLYLFNGQEGGYPSEIVAIDAPSKGELWRLAVGTGTSPSNGMFLAVDDNAQPWLRVGLSQVKPLPNAAYRTLRSP